MKAFTLTKLLSFIVFAPIGNLTGQKFSRQICIKILTIFAILVYMVSGNILRAQKTEPVGLIRIDCLKMINHQGDGNKIVISQELIYFYKEGKVIEEISKNVIEKSIEKLKGTQRSNYRPLTVFDSITYEYEVYNKDNLVVTKMLVDRQGNSYYRTRLLSVIYNPGGHFIGTIYNDFDKFEFFYNQNFIATNTGINTSDTIYFYNSRSELINKKVRSRDSSLDLSDDRNFLKVYSYEGDVAIYNSLGKCAFSQNVKNVIHRDLFNFFVSPDSSFYLVSTWGPKELFMFSTVNNEILWRINFDRTINCLFDEINGLLLICTVVHDLESDNLKHDFYVLTNKGAIIEKLENSELISYDDNKIVLKQGEFYNVYSIK